MIISGSNFLSKIPTQVKGLGQSEMSRYFAITSRAEAEAYLAHSILGPRLRECVRLVLAIEGASAREILGPIDEKKFQSCLTLFAQATRDSEVFITALQKYYGGQNDSLTLQLLKEEPRDRS